MGRLLCLARRLSRFIFISFFVNIFSGQPVYSFVRIWPFQLFVGGWFAAAPAALVVKSSSCSGELPNQRARAPSGA